MRCREAKYRLNMVDRPDRDDALLQHLRGCPSCAKLAHAGQLLTQTLAECRVSSDAATGFAEIRSRLQAYPVDHSRKEDSLMSRIQTRLTSHPKLSLGLSMAVIAFLFVMLVPFSYHRTVGYDLTFSNLNTDTKMPVQKLVDALGKLGYRDVSVNYNISDNGLQYAVTNLPNQQAVQDATFLFDLLSGQQTSPEVKPILKEVSGTLYAQVKENLFETTIEINTEGKTDAEVAAEIVSRLKAAGWDDVQVQTTTNPDGSKQFQIEMSSGE